MLWSLSVHTGRHLETFNQPGGSVHPNNGSIWPYKGLLCPTGRDCPARELWVCTQSTWECSHGAAECRSKAHHCQNVRAKRTSLGIKRRALSGLLISFISPSYAGRRKELASFGAHWCLCIFLSVSFQSNKRHDLPLQILPLL